MTAVTGVSGSGKSTLIKTILVPALKKILWRLFRPYRKFQPLEWGR